MAVKILLLEDDRLFSETLEDFLEEEGFEVVTVLDPYSALDRTFEQNFDLYLFDVNLPYESGFDLLKKLRQSGDMTPTIFLTSREDKESLREGFVLGGDDYIKKPVDLDELLLRIEAVLRRQVRKEEIILGRYRFDLYSKKLYEGEKEIVLSQKAAQLLLVLIEAKGNVVPLDQIKQRLWSTAEDASNGSLRVYVVQLKKYFPQTLKNERGVGYSLEQQ